MFLARSIPSSTDRVVYISLRDEQPIQLTDIGIYRKGKYNSTTPPANYELAEKPSRKKGRGDGDQLLIE